MEHYKEEQLAKDFAKKLNECLDKDYDAINHLTWHLSAKVNDKLANDPHVQVKQLTEKRGFYLGYLGLLNGLLLSIGSNKLIAGHWNNKSELESFNLVDVEDASINPIYENNPDENTE